LHGEFLAGVARDENNCFAGDLRDNENKANTNDSTPIFFIQCGDHFHQPSGIGR
jgi:hypothetical protein